jgi:hypothetical protein
VIFFLHFSIRFPHCICLGVQLVLLEMLLLLWWLLRLRTVLLLLLLQLILLLLQRLRLMPPAFDYLTQGLFQCCSRMLHLL